MSWQGGTQLGDRFHIGPLSDDFYQEPQNKGAVAYTKGQNLSTDPATGNVILCPTANARRPFFVCYEDCKTTDPRVRCWKQQGERLVGITTVALKPNNRLIPSTTVAGQLGGPATEGTTSEALIWGIYKGTLELGVDITSFDVRADDAEAGELIVYDFTPF